jgi:hypothetical protein
MKTLNISITETEYNKLGLTKEKITFSDLVTIIKNDLSEEKTSSNYDSPSLPGVPMSADKFKVWINNAEQEPTISLTEAKEKWASKRKHLKSLTL